MFRVVILKGPVDLFVELMVRLHLSESMDPLNEYIEKSKSRKWEL